MRTETACHPLFVLPHTDDAARELNLPARGANLFQRLIRNPHSDSERGKERQCAEMLCVLLQNAPQLSERLLRWLGGLVGLNGVDFGRLRFSVETEQPIGTKRDDLRIAGYVEGDGRPKLLWTIEVKVSAPFHESAALRLAHVDDSVEDATEPDAVLVNQLVNYDAWLAHQRAEHRAGIVLGLRKLTAQLPELCCTWACTTWTTLGEQLTDAVRTGALPEAEKLLAQHALGFIREHLWRTSEMSELKLDFNDLSLIRAFAVLARECEMKVNALVAPLAEILESSGIGHGKAEHDERLFNVRHYSVSAVRGSLARDCLIYAGIGGEPEAGDFMSVWIQTPSKHAGKAEFKARLQTLKPKLIKRNRRWLFPSAGAETGGASKIDVELTVPLASLLVEDDQAKALQSFVRGALTDLKVVGVVEAFNRTIGRQGRR